MAQNRPFSKKGSVRFTKRSGKAVKTGNAVLVFSTCFEKAVKIKDFICFKQQRSLSKNLNLSVFMYQKYSQRIFGGECFFPFPEAKGR